MNNIHTYKALLNHSFAAPYNSTADTDCGRTQHAFTEYVHTYCMHTVQYNH